LILLDIRLLLNDARPLAVDGETRAAAGDERAGAERRDHFAVAEHELEEIVGFPAAALRRQRRLHAVRNSEQQQRLVDEMRAEVVEESGARSGNLAPSVTDFRPITIDAGFEQHDSSCQISAYRVLDGEEIAVPASVLEHGEEGLLLLRDSRKVSRLFDRNSERLVHDDIAPRVHRRFSERRVRFIGARNYDEVEIGMRGERLGI